LELWTWWWFHCDCGSSKFGVGMWQLQANKEPENSCNIYNQNYKRVYCICKRPHPDPDLPEQCQMLAVLHLWGLVSWGPSWPSTFPAGSVQRFLLLRNVQ
jgi:hypothetical protein